MANHNATMLALPHAGLKVSACGHLIDVSSEGACSFISLRRELVQKLNVANSASLQLLDATGKVIQTDQDLACAMHEAKYPLQAKLTAAALHEIEQKKLEGRSKEHNLHSLQWQIIIEQVASFSGELQSMVGQMQGVKDYCNNKVREFEEQETVRREQFLASMKQETIERKSSQAEVLAKMDSLMQMVLAEQQAREVADYQLSKQSDQVSAEMNSERNARASMQQELGRQMNQIAHDVALQISQDKDKWARNSEFTQRLEHHIEEHSSGTRALTQRIAQLEADMEKTWTSMQHHESTLVRHQTEVQSAMGRHSQELEKAMRDGVMGRGLDMSKIAQDHDTTSQNLGARIQRVRDETAKSHQDLHERTKMLEMRCGALEKDHLEKQEAQDEKHRAFLEKVHSATVALDAFQMEHNASEAILKNTVFKVDDLDERMQGAEAALNNRVSSDHWRTQLEGLGQLAHKQDTKISQLERELQTRFAQEAAHRDTTKAQLHYSMKACMERVADKGLGPKSISPEPRAVETDPSPAASPNLTAQQRPRGYTNESRMTMSTFARSMSDVGGPGKPTIIQTSAQLAVPVARGRSPTPTNVYARGMAPGMVPGMGMSMPMGIPVGSNRSLTPSQVAA